MSARMRWDGSRLEAEMRRAAEDAVIAIAIDLQGSVKGRLNQGASNIMSGGASSAPGQPPYNNTGTLMRSIQIERVDKPNPAHKVGTNVPYARIHEYGGTIRAKDKKLAVPIGVEGRRAARDSGGNIRSLDLQLIPRKGKAPLLARTNADGSITPLFVLMDSVTLPARPYMRPSVDEVERRKVAIADPYIRAALRRLNT